jgi:glutamate-ammonia-ligase adenylyltransferase
MEDSRNTITRGLIRAGIFDISAAQENMRALQHAFAPGQIDSLILETLQSVPDPDVALKAYTELVRAIDACSENVGNTGGADTTALGLPKSRLSHVLAGIAPAAAHFPRLLMLLGSSEEMGRLMMTRLPMVEAVIDDEAFASHEWTLQQRQERLLHAVGAQKTGEQREQWVAQLPFEEATTQLRREYYRQLAAIMAYDVVSEPEAVQPEISGALSDIAQASLEAGLAVAYSKVRDSQLCRFSVIGMGKLGAHELNYVSDVDLIYVIEPAEMARRDGGAAGSGSDGAITLQKLLKIGTKIGIALQKVCSAVIPGVSEPTLWQIDGALRPEGKDGQLVRRLASHEEYYKSWAKNWEFQALLKARCVAGDSELGAAYERMASSFVWQASTRENFVFDCQQMRRRVEKLIPLELKDREIKLGRGGLRDVEFTVQMLQLVHGRMDESLRTSSTLGALEALSAGGYVSRGQAEQLGADYRFERVLEHRAQMWGLRRTHLFPDLGEGSSGGLESSRVIKEGSLDELPQLRRLARVFKLRPAELVMKFDATRSEVRRLHLDIYYRPMLPQIAQLSEDDIALSGEAARDRFESIGFADPDAAIRHVEHLTEGISRSAKINRVILPTMLQWLADIAQIGRELRPR